MKHVLLVLALLPSICFAFEEIVSPNDPDAPWFTGPLLAPSSTAVPVGHFVVQPYVFFTTQTGVYDGHWRGVKTSKFRSELLNVVLSIGLTERLDFQIIPAAVSNHFYNRTTCNWADIPIGFNYQLIESDRKNWYPGLKLSLREILPTGKYQRLNLRKRGTESTGGGSYGTQLAFLFHKLVHLYDEHYISFRFGGSYTTHSNVHVRGFNTYGGGFGTKGTVKPGDLYSAIFSFEYAFTKNWVFALDTLYLHENKTSFHGNLGTVFAKDNPIFGNLPAKISSSSSDQLSFAPAIEYNVSDNFGWIGGVWFSACGRKSSRFISGVISCVYAY